jgi:hypothetical protein
MADLTDNLQAYTPEETDIRRAMAYANALDGPIKDEGAMVPANLRQTLDLRVPPAIPATLVLAKDTIAHFKANLPGFDWVAMHQATIQDNAWARIVELPGNHMIYRTNAAAIKGIVDETVARKE